MHVGLIAILLLWGTGLAAAEPEYWKPAVDPSQHGAETRPEARHRANVDLIVQFRAPASGMTTAAIAKRREALSARLTELRGDLARLDKTPRIAAAGTDDARIRRTWHRVLFGASIRVPRTLRRSIEALPYVASVHEDREYRLSSVDSPSRLHAARAWSELGTRGAGVTVAVIDSGIDYRHPAFGGGIGSGFKVIGGWDFVENDAEPIDTLGHGTHVAGIIAANGGGLLGVAPDASLLAYRVFGGETGSAADVIAALERAVDPNQDGNPADHPDIINLSLGGMPSENDPVVAAVENATAAGVLFCIAAGNGGDFGNVQSPGIAPSAITAGASDDAGNVAGFSSRGPSLFFTIKPEVMAPGVSILSAAPGGSNARLSGTSMAAPYVAGVAALVKATHRDWSPAQIKSAIVTTAARRNEDVMLGGAGPVDALAATTVTTLASPAVASFGQIDATKAVWSATKAVALRNVSSAPQTLSAAVHGLGDGVAVTVTPPAVTIAPGESASVDIQLTVTKADLPAQEDGSLSFSGRVEWSGGAVPIQVPWAFVNGAFLAIQVADAEEETIAEILGTRWKRTTNYFHGFIRVLWPMETVDVVVVEAGRFAAPPERIVAVEQIDAATAPLVTVRLADAQFVISTDTSDEKGAPLATQARDCKDQFIFAFPQGRKFTREQMPSTPALFGAFSDRVKLYVTTHCADTATSTLYTSIHEPRLGLHGSFTSTSRPQWTRHDVQFQGDGRGFLTVAYPSVRFPGPESSFFVSGGRGLLMRPTPSQLTIYSARGFVEEVDLLTTLERVSMCNRVSMGGQETACPEIASAFVYLGEHETRVDGELYLDVSPMAYRAPAGAPLTFTAGPFWARIILLNDPRFFQAVAEWAGPMSETRYFEEAPPPVTMRDETGKPTGFWSPMGHVFGAEPLPPGAYRIDATHSQSAKATASALFDTRRADAQYPQFTGLRIVDADQKQTSIVQRNAAASLVFSIADHLATRRVPPREEATRVEYRPHGTSEWRPLTPLVEARHYLATNVLPAGVGTMYRVDLSPVTRTVTGPVDIRVHAEDTAGNAMEMLLEPALVVAMSGRRRTVRH